MYSKVLTHTTFLPPAHQTSPYFLNMINCIAIAREIDFRANHQSIDQPCNPRIRCYQSHVRD